MEGGARGEGSNQPVATAAAADSLEAAAAAAAADSLEAAAKMRQKFIPFSIGCLGGR